MYKKSLPPIQGARTQRHSLCQMTQFKLNSRLSYRSSQQSLFSTALISSSSSAPNLSDMLMSSSTTPSGNIFFTPKKGSKHCQLFLSLVFLFVPPTSHTSAGFIIEL
jgi:hypothetical protein